MDRVTAPKEIRLDLPHIRLSAKVWGDASLPPLLALHGWLDNAGSFDRLAPLLCGKFHIVAIDFPGHGRSDWRPPGAWYHYIDYVSDVVAAVDSFGWKRFHLLGHSLGGTVASVVAACRPQVIDKLLLIEALGPIAGDPANALEQLRRGIDQREAFEEKSLRVFAREDDAIDVRRKVSDLSSDAATAIVSRGLKAVTSGFSWSSDPRLTLATPMRFTEEQILATLCGIAAPTFLVLAQPDAPYLPRETMQRRIEQVPDIEVHRIDGGHHLHLENPQPIADLIGAFVAKN
jgi:pimeloyl-ACP methyl ester carboxylesterase